MIIRASLSLMLFASAAFGEETKLLPSKMPEAAEAQAPRAAPDYLGELFGNEALPRKAMFSVLSKELGDRGLSVARGSKEIDFYKRASDTVVLVVTDQALGSGIYLGNRTILTNWHVVKSSNQVGVAFKPRQQGGKTAPASILSARVVKFDQIRDLALLQVDTVPTVRPMELGSEAEVELGAEIYVIGHPSGDEWTYTRGIIGQVRKDYEWKTATGRHKANVVQTQTPIDPGSSGSALIGASGRFLGISSLKAPGEGLNFAVSIGDVKNFLSGPSALPNPTSPGPSTSCVRQTVYEGRSKNNLGMLTQFDQSCRGNVDFSMYIPDNKKDAVLALLDSNADGNVDLVIKDIDRDRRWDISFHDVDFDGTIDLVGFHPDGKLSASRFEKFDPKRNYAAR